MLGNSDAEATGGDSDSSSGARRNEDDTASPFLLPAAPLHSSLENLIVECSAAIAQEKWRRSFQLIRHLGQRTSGPEGDSTDRVITHFVDSLTARVITKVGETEAVRQLGQEWRSSSRMTDAELYGAYLSLNQVTPFIRFTHLTANQAILEAFQGWSSVHIVDINVMQGVQWPPLMQALAARTEGSPRIRISAIGPSLSLLEQTGSLLTTFASSLGLPMFEFCPLHAQENDILHILSPSSLGLREDETLAINMSIPHPKFSLANQDAFIRIFRSLRPSIITVADREVNHNTECSVIEAFRHYRAFFGSLEATLPPSSQERSNVEGVWLRGEIMHLFAGCSGHEEDGCQILGGAPCLKWRELLSRNGFRPLSHSPFAISQARLLLRLHYPSQGYELKDDDDALLLGWQGTPLFGVSSWNA
ncbi:hypothetical protein KP509_29G015000 [Ceratopteris richardii]|nr:hypothetical protein KP509_29G015000 [Ceratopteris richardii]